jgi:aspartate/methionine/tyrosine aminotransferase
LGSLVPLLSISQAAAWAAKYKPTATQPLLNVSQGAPSAPPPPELLEALGAAASDGASSGYLTPRGSSELASALAKEMHATYGRVGLEADIKPDDLAITAGCNLAYAAAVQALCDPGDEVILPVPWYFNHQYVLSEARFLRDAHERQNDE